MCVAGSSLPPSFSYPITTYYYLHHSGTLSLRSSYTLTQLSVCARVCSDVCVCVCVHAHTSSWSGTSAPPESQLTFLSIPLADIIEKEHTYELPTYTPYPSLVTVIRKFQGPWAQHTWCVEFAL